MGSSTQSFLEIFHSFNFDEQSLLCKLFLHNIMCEYVSTKMVASVFSYMGDLQLRAFLSFMRNQIEWHLAMKSTEANEERKTLWVRAKPGMVYELKHEFKLFLSTLEIREQSTIYRKRIVRICLNLHAHLKTRALLGCFKHNKACSAELQEEDPFEYRNSMSVVTWVPEYAQIVQTLGAFWIRLRFRFPLIWLPVEEYRLDYHLCDYEEESWPFKGT